VNDGSSDGTLPALLECRSRDARIKIVDFARNFGKEAALTAGLDFAKGDAVVPIDSDLQHPPETIPEMVRRWQEGHMVVLARRRTRKTDGVMRRIMSSAFYEVINSLSEIEIPRGVGDFRLMDRRVADAVRQLRERKRFMKGLFAWTGFRPAVVEFDVAPRVYGATTFLSVALDFCDRWHPELQLAPTAPVVLHRRGSRVRGPRLRGLDRRQDALFRH
jgi:glycosyltransferase involved in cell wall biosynthesis